MGSEVWLDVSHSPPVFNTGPEWFRATDVVHREGCRFARGMQRWNFGSNSDPSVDKLRLWARSSWTVDPCKVCCPEAWVVEAGVFELTDEAGV